MSKSRAKPFKGRKLDNQTNYATPKINLTPKEIATAKSRINSPHFIPGALSFAYASQLLDALQPFSIVLSKLGKTPTTQQSLVKSVSAFQKEIKFNLDILKEKDGSNALVLQFFDGVEGGFKQLESSYSKDSLEFISIKSDSPAVKERKYFVNEALLTIAQERHNYMVSSIKIAPNVKIDPKKVLTLTERLIIFKCLQKNKLFEKETQETSQKDIIMFLGLITGKDNESIKKAYRQSEAYLSGKGLTNQEKRSAIKSLRSAEVAIKTTKNKSLTTILEKRIKELELHV